MSSPGKVKRSPLFFFFFRLVLSTPLIPRLLPQLPQVATPSAYYTMCSLKLTNDEGADSIVVPTHVQVNAPARLAISPTPATITPMLVIGTGHSSGVVDSRERVIPDLPGHGVVGTMIR